MAKMDSAILSFNYVPPLQDITSHLSQILVNAQSTLCVQDRLDNRLPASFLLLEGSCSESHSRSLIFSRSAEP